MTCASGCQPINCGTIIAIIENAPGSTTEWRRPVRYQRASAHDAGTERKARNRFMPEQRSAKFDIGQVVKHNLFDFRGVVFDVDPEFANTEEWWQAIPESVRPQKDQPFYHLLATNGDSCYVAYASEGNLRADETGQPLSHPQTRLIFERFENGRYKPKSRIAN
jgi:heat shock protein HspQ